MSKARKKRHQRIRNKISGTPDRPRLNVYRSLKHIYAQVIDDLTSETLVAASTLDAEIKDKIDNGGNVDAAQEVGKLVAKRAIDKGIEKVVFDRGGDKYHGRIKALAEAARENGLEF
ncbi:MULTISPECIES: 50S ribosomal protein L18 [unclassified Candidatus Frackibacter]|jgi:large subunit ribosomal protein L18|uniref:50S ribosomal protein L18 n=1 Tax=unclassified Candidatus Frackibacter TaxID=2648818 RepID=UPI000795D841|nr:MULTISPECIES: 50S ribosomal protein L18 [unclassified Candidatus Frackibacter]KXS45781.1 MAG: large subunit ribosomal protein L18 [Candidatus Frackibacter sp. T328-2]SDC22401.1 LSU ribosomal protein L18P [Candidatus Frackibacter sp. WG11]SEM49497.1 LSU ribosomal protein L18P [Candidatus Frackibacter sp. WG12]SFL51017.1 LSU ribosomal protein L18P [Candidatus Frackibacter sp. WG13]